MNKNRFDHEVNNYSIQFISNDAKAIYIIASSIINVRNSIKYETSKKWIQILEN